MAADKAVEGDSCRRVAFVGTAVAKSVGGRVEFLCKKSWLPVKNGQAFTCGQVCRVKAGGSVIFQMRSSGSLVRAGENTLVRFCPLDERMPVASLTGYEAITGGAAVRAVRGKAEYLDEHSNWQPLRVNSSLTLGTSVRTGDKTTVDLFFADSGLVVRMHPDSRVILNQIPLVCEGQIQANRKTSKLLANVANR